jgi:hypothetical protein
VRGEAPSPGLVAHRPPQERARNATARASGTGELADEGVPPGLVRAGSQAVRLMPGPRALPHTTPAPVIDTTSPGVALHAQEQVERTINQVAGS